MFLVASNVRTKIAPPIFQEIFQVHFCCQFQGVSTFKTWKTWTSLWTLGLETIFPTMYLLLLNLASASDLGLGRHQALLLATFNMESSLFMCCWSMMDRWGDGVKIPNNHIFKDVVFFKERMGYTGIPWKILTAGSEKKIEVWMRMFSFCKWVILRFHVDFQHAIG